MKSQIDGRLTFKSYADATPARFYVSMYFRWLVSGRIVDGRETETQKLLC
jgi:hypothetical protein